MKPMVQHIVQVASRTTNDTHYVTVSQDWRSYRCTCTGFSIRGRCYHGDKVLQDKQKGSKVTQTVPDDTPQTPLPMLAKPLTDKVKIIPGKYTAEVKYDGFRVMAHVASGRVRLWSRTGKDALHRVSPQLLKEIQLFPDGYYDGELVVPGEGTYSSDVANKENQSKLVYVIFDALRLLNKDMAEWKQRDRRKQLEVIFTGMKNLKMVQLSTQWSLDSRQHLDAIVEELWSESIEGVIVKNGDAPYSPGKRTDAFMKLKELNDENVMITGFEASSGEINNRGACAVTICVDKHGVEVRVKTKNDQLCEEIAKNPSAWIRRTLNIEYQRKTPDGSYRHPRWHMIVEN